MKSVNVKQLAKFLAKEFDVKENLVQKSIEKFVEAQENIKELYLIPDYSDKAAALFGNTKPAFAKLKELNEDKKKVAGFNAKLAFGPGIVIPKKYLSEVKKFLAKNKFDFEEIKRDDYESRDSGGGKAKKSPKKEDSSEEESGEESEPLEEELDMEALKKRVIEYAKKNPNTGFKTLLSDMEEEFGKDVKVVKKQIERFVVESGISYSSMKVDDLKKELGRRGLPKTGKKDELIDRLKENDAGGTKAKSTKEKTSPPKAKSGATTLKAKKNQWGNFEDPETGVVFMQLPVGDSKDPFVPVAIGVQDPEADSEAEGVETVDKFDKKMVKECEKNHFRVLTKELAVKLKKKDSKLYNQVKRFVV
jgi:hypothetical protein